MAINASSLWRIRAGGNDTNGGGYDSAISGAGTDYTEQDAAQLTLTDLATSGAGSTTLTSATGGFTSQMVGNAIRISSGTNFQTGYYFVTAYTDANTVTVDRTPTSGGAGSGGNGKLGGAFATVAALCNGGNATLPSVTTPLAAGHTVWIRGSGGEDPGSADYTYTKYHQFPAGDTTNGKIALIGYNGRPRIDSNYLWLYLLSYWHIEGLHIKATGTSNGSLGWCGDPGAMVSIVNCWTDQAGFDVTGVKAQTVERCRFFNTGSSSAGTAANAAIILSSNYGGVVSENDVNGWRGRGVVIGSVMPNVTRNVIRNCKSDGIYVTSGISASFGFNVRGNSVYGNTSDGLEVAAGADVTMLNCEYNIFEANGGYGVNFAGTQATNDRRIRSLMRKNFYYNNTSGARNGITAGSEDVTLTGSAFTNAGSGDFTLNNTSGAGAAVRAAAGVVMPGSVGTSYLDGGAIQHQDSGGSGGGGPLIGGRLIQ